MDNPILDELAAFILENNLYSKSPIQIYNAWVAKNGNVNSLSVPWLLDYIIRIVHTDKDILSQSLKQ